MAGSNLELRIAGSPVLRYGLAALSVSAALGGALLLERFHFRNVADPLFLLAIAVTVWYAGVGPAILSVVLCGIADTYFFIEPIYSLYITRDDLPHFVIFVLFASLLTGFAAVRRRVEGDLVQARDELQIEVTERTQQASLLNLTHDPIFVRDMSDVITYWNRGRRSCTDGPKKTRWEGVHRSCCKRFFNATRGHPCGVAADQPLGGRA
jgi:PAS domain-containing protein